MSKPKTVAIVGAGLVGRIATLAFWKNDWRVSLFDSSGRHSDQSSTYVAAGMLAPFSELVDMPPAVSSLALKRLASWPEILSLLPVPVFYRQMGSLIVAHRLERKEFEFCRRKIASHLADLQGLEQMKLLSGYKLFECEPQLVERFDQALFFPLEGQIHPREFIESTQLLFEKELAGIHFDTKVVRITANRVETESKSYSFDLVVDARGVGARDELNELRCVRGEIITVHAPEVLLVRPVRLLHPRYPLYVVPRPGNMFVIGATSLESASSKKISLQSALELLSALFSIQAGFAQCEIVEMNTGLRPALPDNKPKIWFCDGLMRINGFYRHGFLLAPTLFYELEHLIRNGTPSDCFKEFSSREGKHAAFH